MRQSVTVVIQNRLGLHARPAMAFVDTAKGFDAAVRVSREDISVDGKSIMEMMMLAATQGTELLIECDGDDAEDCCGKLKALVDARFDEE